MSNKLISILDTHRLPYKNAVLTAKDMNSVTIHFYDASDNDVGESVYTNAAGYLCDHNGALYSGGVFVKVDAEITATFDNGATTSWNCMMQFRTDIGEGKLVGKSRGGSDLDKQEIFNANQSEDSELWYGNILGLPVINSWAESDQIVYMTQPNDSVAVDKFAKTIIVGVKSGVSIDDSAGWSLTLSPDELRFGQNIAVVNVTDYRLTLKNTDGVPFAYVNASGDDNVTMISLGGAVDRKFRNSVDTQMLHTKVVEVTGSVLIEVDDLTPDMLIIHIPDTATAFASSADYLYLNIDNKCTNRRIVKVVLINDMTKGGAKLRCQATGSTEYCTLISGKVAAILLPGKANRDGGDNSISPVYGAELIHPYLGQTFSYATPASGTPLKLHVPIGVEYIEWTATIESSDIFYLDETSERVVKCVITNTTGDVLPVYFRLKDETELGYVLVENNESRVLVFKQFGDTIHFLKGSDNMLHPSKNGASEMYFLTAIENVEYCVNIAAYCARHSLTLGNSFKVALPVFTGTKKILFDIASIIEPHGTNNFTIDVKMSGVTGEVNILTIPPTDMEGGARYLSFANHTRVLATLTCTGVALSGSAIAVP